LDHFPQLLFAATAVVEFQRCHKQNSYDGTEPYEERLIYRSCRFTMWYYYRFVEYCGSGSLTNINNIDYRGDHEKKFLYPAVSAKVYRDE
jgi:hypothetical protein